MAVIPTLTPPTDNLYKFIAIFGLVLVVVAVFLPMRQYDKLDDAYARAMEIADRLRAHATLDLDLAIHEAKEREQEESVSPAIRTKRERLHQERKEEKERLDALDLEISSKLISLRFQASRWLIVAIVVGSIGVLLMGAGFWLWYARLQKHQDSITALQVAKIATELAEKV